MITQSLILAVIVVVSLPAVAQQAGEGAPAPMTVHLEGSRLSRLFNEIERVSGHTVVFDKDLGKVGVSLSVSDIAWDRLAALVGFALELDPVQSGDGLEFLAGDGSEVSALDITQCRRRELDGSMSFTILRFTSEDDFTSMTVKDMGAVGGFVRIRRCGEGHRTDATASRADGKG
jgi:hypothetical protein